MNKDQLLDALEESRDKFLDVIEGLSEADMERPEVVGDWSVKDVMSHISAWEAELIKMLWQLRQNQKPTSIHFTNPATDEVNAAWHEEYKRRPFDRVFADFEAVRNQTMRRVDAFSDKDLTDPERYPWLRGEPLWKWVAGDSFEHETEHRLEIEEWLKREGFEA